MEARSNVSDIPPPTPKQDRDHARRSRRYHVACIAAAEREARDARRMGDLQSATAFDEVAKVQQSYVDKCTEAGG